MNVGKIAGAAALLGGTAALGAAATYASVTAAGESEGGPNARLLGALGSGGGTAIFGVVAGGVGVVASNFVGKGAWLPGALSGLALPAGIAGAVMGARLARSGLESRHQPEYDENMQAIDRVMVDTQDVLRDAGADDDVLSRVRESYDRSFFNAAYKPPIGGFRNEIVVGRNSENGQTLAIDDVIAHEFTHKVLHAYAPDLLASSGDGLAIHESIADTFAMLVDRDDWTMGEDAWDGGLRSFSNPEIRGAMRSGVAEPAPITRAQLTKSTEPHLGAGVGNKAAWRIGSELGRDTMGRIYVAALERRELGSGATYADLAKVVRSAATELYGADSREAAVVDDSWTKAGY